MTPTPSQWLAHLQRQSLRHGLPYLDLLIDATGLDYPLHTLDTLSPATTRAYLLDSTQEHAIAHEGPQLVRLTWQETEHTDWLTDFITQTQGRPRAIVVFSHWPFAEVARHLSLCTQADWDQGLHGGLLRYWDPRLLLACSETLTSAQGAWFHGPVIAWHWLDRDGKAAELPGRPCRQAEMPQAPNRLSLSNDQVAELVAWTEAEAFRMATYIQPHQYGLPNKEALMRHLMHAQRAADREHLYDPDARNHYLRDWLSRHSPTFPREETV